MCYLLGSAYDRAGRQRVLQKSLDTLNNTSVQYVKFAGNQELIPGSLNNLFLCFVECSGSLFHQLVGISYTCISGVGNLSSRIG